MPRPDGPGGRRRADERTITVSGHGTVSVVPDIADLMAGVQAQAATATEALDTVGTKSQALIDTLKGVGHRRRGHPDVRPQPVPDVRQRRPTITGYQASTSVTATIARRADRSATVVDALKALVGEELTLQGVSFSYDDPEAVMADARAAAIANAKVRAEQYADGRRRRGRRGAADRRGERGAAGDVPGAGRRRAPPRPTRPRSPSSPGSQDLAADVSVVYAMG